MAFVPNDPYGNLPRERQEIFGQIPGTDYIPSRDLAEVRTEWALAFGYNAVDYESMGIDKETVSALRDKFFEYMGLEWDNFPWDDWREAMGYEQ